MSFVVNLSATVARQSKLRIALAIDLAHAADPKGGDDLVWADARAGAEAVMSQNSAEVHGQGHAARA